MARNSKPKIFKRGKTYWLDGRPHGLARQSLKTSDGDRAIHRARAILRQHGVIAEGPTVADLLARWQIERSDEWKPHTRKQYAWLSGKLNVYFGSAPADELSRVHIRELKRDLRSRGLAPKTIDQYLQAISSCYRWALSEDLVERLPVIERQKAGRDIRSPKTLSHDELRRLREHARGTRMEPVIELALQLGLRTGTGAP
jgi:site-specific recombinase XerC